MKHFLRKIFVPHHTNDHKPHILRDASIAVVLALILISEIYFLSQSFFFIPKGKFLANVLASAVVDLTNSKRGSDALGELQQNALLQQAAQAKANDMAARSYFSHNSPDGNTPWYWLQQVGYKYKYAGENLAVNYFDSKDVVNAWMNSPSHKANILNKDFTEIGIGTAEGIYKGSKAIFVVQFFAKPVVASSLPTQTTPQKTTIPPKHIATSKPAAGPRLLSSAEKNTITPTKEVAAKAFGYHQMIAQVASPRHATNTVLYIVGSLLLIAAIIAVLNKLHLRHPKLVTRSFLLVAVIAIFIVFNKELVDFYGLIA